MVFGLKKYGVLYQNMELGSVGTVPWYHNMFGPEKENKKLAHSLTYISCAQVKCEKKGIEVVTLLLSEILDPVPDPLT